MGWLTSYHAFSFNRFYDPERIHFGPLRVLNDDFVMPSSGFGDHPHDNMEIVTYVLSGALEHKDSSGGHGIINAGDVQRMRAGTGIVHSEYNNSETTPVHLLQIWFFPQHNGLTPGYEQLSFKREQRLNTLLAVASPDLEADGVHIQTPATMYISLLEKDKSVTHKLAEDHGAYVYLINGEMEINGAAMKTGDAATVVGEKEITLVSSGDAEMVVFDILG